MHLIDIFSNPSVRFRVLPEDDKILAVLWAWIDSRLFVVIAATGRRSFSTQFLETCGDSK